MILQVAKRRLIIVIALALALLVLAVALTIATTPEPITLHNLNARGFGDSVLVNLEVSNHTSHAYTFIPLRLEVCDSPTWRVCPDGIHGFSQSDGVQAHSGGRISCVVKR